MDWADHANSFKRQWIVRYLDPSVSAWKLIIDEYVLKSKKGKLKYPEGRSILLQNLSTSEKANILGNFPRKATYFKECLREFWKLKITPAAGRTGLPTESPWPWPQMAR